MLITGMFAAFIFCTPGTIAVESTGMKTIASGRLVMASSIWLICSGILSGLVGTKWMMAACICFAALSAPSRTD